MIGHWSKKQGVAVMVLGMTCALAAAPKDADACGACFTSATESTVVNDHKMALKITNQQTILWDQITYTGNPREFAYVVPARPGTKLEASNDGFFAALDLTTRPIIMAPQPQYGGGGGYDGDGRGGGCGCGSDDMSAAFSDRSAGANASPPPVQIVDQAVVGPYQTVTLRSTEPKALHEWLNQNGYAMPESAGPIIEQYVNAQFDFIAMRLAPGGDVRSMKPIRIVSPTPDAELPLRMMQIGAGAKVGITLYVLAEGRYQPKNFPLAQIDKTKLIWDYGQNRSNYQELSLKAMEAGDGRSMLVEFANKANMTDTGTPYQPQPTGYGSGMGSNPSLPDAYRATCKPDPLPTTPPLDASFDEDAGASADAATDAGGDADVDGGEEDAGATATADAGIRKDPTKECDDLESLADGMNTGDLWITRIRSNLPNAALAETLKLEAAPQEPVDNVYQVTSTGTITARIARTRTGRAFGSATIILGTMFFFSRILRRRRHQSKS
jgi:hypothetical protein